MKTLFPGAGVIVLALMATGAMADIRKQLSTFDRDKNGIVDAAEFAAFRPVARANIKGDDDLLELAVLEDQIKSTGFVSLAVAKSSRSDPKHQRLFLRRDRGDVSIYTEAVVAGSSKGAAFSFSEDHQNGGNKGSIDAVISYVIASDTDAEAPPGSGPLDTFLSGYAIAAWIELDGGFDSAKTDFNSLRVGGDGQFEFSGGEILNLQSLTITPFVQTDFDWEALAFGVQLRYEATQLDWNLGGKIAAAKPAIFDYYWQFRAEADVFHVDRVGNTKLKADTEYAWLGGTIGLTALLLPRALDERLYLKGTGTYFWDALSDTDVSQVKGELGFNLTESGSSSISIEHVRGRTKETLKHEEKTTINLNVKI